MVQLQVLCSQKHCAAILNAWFFELQRLGVPTISAIPKPFSIQVFFCSRKKFPQCKDKMEIKLFFSIAFPSIKRTQCLHLQLPILPKKRSRIELPQQLFNNHSQLALKPYCYRRWMICETTFQLLRGKWD